MLPPNIEISIEETSATLTARSNLHAVPAQSIPSQLLYYELECMLASEHTMLTFLDLMKDNAH